MSHFYLCTTCRHVRERKTAVMVECACHGTVPGCVMVDQHGKGGVRYLDPREVCPTYERKEEVGSDG